MGKGKRFLSDEEKRLWEEATRNTKRLPKATMEVPEEAEPELTPTRRVSPKPPKLPASSPLPDLAQGNYAGIDRATADRFRKGKQEIDGTLDLHGYRQLEAHEALERFIGKHYAKGSRCLLVITGKGLAKGSEGVLRAQLPKWLAGENLRPFVLAFDAAQAQHGGAGAYYILLKRKRS